MAELLGVENTVGAQVFVALGQATTVAGYKALPWKEIIGVVSIGELGDTEATVSQTPIPASRNYHTNGLKDGGMCNISIMFATGDEGRELIGANGGTNNTVSLRKVYPSGDVEMVFGRFKSLRAVAIEGQEGVVRGYNTTLMVNSVRTDATASEYEQATAA